jgi:hypothetical protein
MGQLPLGFYDDHHHLALVVDPDRHGLGRAGVDLGLSVANIAGDVDEFVQNKGFLENKLECRASSVLKRSLRGGHTDKG